MHPSPAQSDSASKGFNIELQKELSTTKAELQATKTELDKTKKELEATKNNSLKRVSTLEKENAALTTENQALKKEIASSKGMENKSESKVWTEPKNYLLPLLSAPIALRAAP